MTACTHSSDTLCQACDAPQLAAYLTQHPPPGDLRRNTPHPGRHPYIPDDMDASCTRCEMPRLNARHRL